MTNVAKTRNAENQPIGCGLLILTILASTWVIGLCAIDLFLNWIAEQSMIEASFVVPDFRWITHALCSGLILLVCSIFTVTVNQPRIKMIFRLWTYAAIFAVLAIPLKTLFLTAQNETAIFQIGAMALMLIGSKLFEKKKTETLTENEQKHRSLSGLTAFLGAALCIPWLLWGALGSILDTLLEVVVGIMFAWLSVKLLFSSYLEKEQFSNREVSTRDIIIDGFVIVVFLLIMVTALAHNGSQQLLIITVPVTGWLITIFSVIGQGNGKLQAKVILALAIALPLMFFDMDELSAVFTGGRGETLEWAVKAAWFTFFGFLFITIILLPNVKSFMRINLPKRANLGFIIAGLISIMSTYLIWGQVGFFGDNQFIILKEHTDLSALQNIPDVVQRRLSVYNALVSNAVSSQVEIRARLDQYHLNYTSYYLLNAIEVKGGSLVKLFFQNDPSVDRILDSPQLRPLPQKTELEKGDINSLPDELPWNLSMIQADRVNKELGITGKGILIGQTDSGVDGSHLELKGSYRGVDSGGDYNWYDPWNNTPFPTDFSGHGTLTLGVILGESTGIAPDAKWIGCVNLARNLGNPARYLDCMQFMLAPFPQGEDPFTDGDPLRGAMIINNSWGCPPAEGCDAAVFQPAVEAIETAGIFMSVAAGNSGYYGCGTVTDPPAIYADVFTAGSINRNGDLSDFSSLGPVIVDGSGRVKPDLLAPGENIISAFPGGTYSQVSGTSFSAPHVSGVVALMWSANPELIGDIEATSDILRKTAKAYEGIDPICGEVNDGVGTGLLNAYQAVQAAIAYKRDLP